MENINILLRLNLELDGALRSLQARDDSETKEFVREKYGALVAAMDAFLNRPPVFLPEEFDKGDTPPSADTEIIAVSDEPEVEAEESVAVAVAPEVEAAAPEVVTEEPEVVADEPLTVAQESEEDSVLPLPNLNDDEPLRVADKISVLAAVQDLKHSFSLNDKFRFIRTIFGGSADKFNEAVGHIESLQTLRQAYDYMLKDLAMDVEREDDCDFMTIVANHFNTI